MSVLEEEKDKYYGYEKNVVFVLLVSTHHLLAHVPIILICKRCNDEKWVFVLYIVVVDDDLSVVD